MSPLITDVVQGAGGAAKAAKGAASAAGAAEKAALASKNVIGAAQSAGKALGAAETAAEKAEKFAESAQKLREAARKDLSQFVGEKDKKGVVRSAAGSAVRALAFSPTFGLSVVFFIFKDLAEIYPYRNSLYPSFTRGIVLWGLVWALDVICIILYFFAGAGIILDSFVGIVEFFILGAIYFLSGFKTSTLGFLLTGALEFVPIVNIIPIWTYQCYGALMRTWKPQVHAAKRLKQEQEQDKLVNSIAQRKARMQNARERIGLHDDEEAEGGEEGNSENRGTSSAERAKMYSPSNPSSQKSSPAPEKSASVAPPPPPPATPAKTV